MIKINYSKKATSLIIATIFLFAFALSIGVIITKLGNEINLDNEICNEKHDLELYAKEGIEQTCIEKINKTHSLINIGIKNIDENTFYGLKFSLTGNSSHPGYVHREFNIVLHPFGKVYKSIEYPNSIGTIKEARISVYKRIGSTITLCPQTELIITNIPLCEDEEQA